MSENQNSLSPQYQGRGQGQGQDWIPVLPIRNSVIFPGISLPIKVTRPLGIQAIEQAQKYNQLLLALTQKDNLDKERFATKDLFSVGTLVKLENVRNLSSGLALRVTGTKRVRVSNIEATPQFFLATFEDLPDSPEIDQESYQALLRNIKTVSMDILGMMGETQPMLEFLENTQDLPLILNFCCQNLNLPLKTKQELLENVSLQDKGMKILDLLLKRKEYLKLQVELSSKISDKFGKVQRDAILREQLEAIKEELGEGEKSSVTDNYRQKISAAKMPKDVEKVALEELKKLESLGGHSPEAPVIRNYLDLLCQLPWPTSTTTAADSEPQLIDLSKARKTLNEDHYGLEKVKERIIQHLAVMKIKKDKKGSILLLVGPPGVGKTSLGKSIASALERPFVRIGLGGVRDDSEIRGHRRTYIGAMPGRIIQGIKKAGKVNPVFVLDEIDKLSRSFNGDPASALLEVLDPEQNSNFLDHYLDLPYDLSQVFFVATANSLETIPGPLLDRMEVIELSGYTDQEKLFIANSHLVPKQLEEHGLTSRQLHIGPDIQQEIITNYTREAGVRELQRKIANVCRAYTERVLETKDSSQFPLVVSGLELVKVLGHPKYTHEIAEMQSLPGVVTGLAWTPVGGEILFIETSSMPGTGRLILTGQLGEVMKESAQIALSLVRSQFTSRIPLLQSDYKFHETDLHVHVPSGAIPKDGPSAGIALVTAMASLISGKAVDSKLAMSGEITLRGTVMPVGGIKEKIIAAHRAGVEKVILSSRNRKDLAEIPQEVKDRIEFHFVDHIQEVFKLALELNPVPVPSPKEIQRIHHDKDRVFPFFNKG